MSGDPQYRPGGGGGGTTGYQMGPSLVPRGRSPSDRLPSEFPRRPVAGKTQKVKLPMVVGDRVSESVTYGFGLRICRTSDINSRQAWRVDGRYLFISDFRFTFKAAREGTEAEVTT